MNSFCLTLSVSVLFFLSVCLSVFFFYFFLFFFFPSVPYLFQQSSKFTGPLVKTRLLQEQRQGVWQFIAFARKPIHIWKKPKYLLSYCTWRVKLEGRTTCVQTVLIRWQGWISVLVKCTQRQTPDTNTSTSTNTITKLFRSSSSSSSSSICYCTHTHPKAKALPTIFFSVLYSCSLFPRDTPRGTVSPRLRQTGAHFKLLYKPNKKKPSLNKCRQHIPMAPLL